jgi:hypothetical protein
MNGVKLREILSLNLFCFYMDGILKKLAGFKVGSYIGLRTLVYVDDITLLAPDCPENLASDMQRIGLR